MEEQKQPKKAADRKKQATVHLKSGRKAEAASNLYDEPVSKPTEVVPEPDCFKTGIPNSGDATQPQILRSAQEPVRTEPSKHMPRTLLSPQVKEHTETFANAIQEQINESSDMSPSEYAEQKTEQYSGMVVHRAGSTVDRAGNKLRERTIKHFREKKQEDRQADKECDQQDAEVQAAEIELNSEQMRETSRYPETEADSFEEPSIPIQNLQQLAIV